MIAAALSVLVCSCGGNRRANVENNKPMDTNLVRDPHSCAQPDEALVKHLDWNAKVDFDKKIITATATWTLERKNETREVFFDTYGLNITSVTDVNGNTLEYELAAPDKILGSALRISLPEKTDQVVIHYHTSPDAQAVQWLSAEQTADKKYPFLFTQSQAILGRSWLPAQDGPGYRFTYTADVEVPKGFMALMSTSNPTQISPDGKYHFEQKKPIPAYLMALAVGVLEFKPVGERTGVYAEPSLIDKSVWEFADMEKMLEAAENLYGAYAWGRYDVLVLPPSFPFGGMENPVLTFATPTIIAGDRSLVSLIAHELAHSWSGNLVTNATWNDFWLNEGFTVYFERRIMEAIEGKSYADMLSYLGYDDVKFTVADLMAEGRANDTRLKLSLDGRDPDEGMNDIAYEKGYCFLLTIEKAVGREKFDKFLKDYFAAFAFKTMTTEKFLDYLHENLIPEGSDADKAIAWKQWIYEPGFPGGFVAPVSERFNNVEKVSEAYLASRKTSDIDTAGWSSHEWQYFLRLLMDSLTAEDMKALDAAFEFTRSGNSEIAALWFEASLQHAYAPAYPSLEKFLSSVGRRKFLVPLYRAAKNNPKTAEMGKEVYLKYRKNYHAVSVKTLDDMWNVAE